MAEDLPYSVIKPTSLASAGGFFTSSATWEASWESIRLCFIRLYSLLFLKGLPALFRQFTYSNSGHSILVYRPDKCEEESMWKSFFN